jgi:glycerate 2-kinase
VLDFSDNVLAFFGDEELEETPKPTILLSGPVVGISLLSSDDLCRIAGESAMRLGFHVVVDNGCDDWKYREAATYLLNRLQ